MVPEIFKIQNVFYFVIYYIYQDVLLELIGLRSEVRKLGEVTPTNGDGFATYLI